MALAIIQARMTSTRLPGKSLRLLAGRPSLGWVIRAARESGVCSRVVVATSTRSSDDPIAQYADSLQIDVVRGPIDDVLDRFIMALDRFPEEPVVRLTADCPLLDPNLIRMCVNAFNPDDIDYLSTTLRRTLPRGMDVEVCSREALRSAGVNAQGEDRIHVTSHIHRRPTEYRVSGVSFEPTTDHYRLTLDTADDARALDELISLLGDRAPSRYEVIALLNQRPDISAINKDVRQKPFEEG